MAKSLPNSLRWLAIAFVTVDASRSPVSVEQEAPPSGAQLLQIESKGRKDGILHQQHADHLVTEKPACHADAVIFDLLTADISNNNLGGQGPGDGPNMRIENVGVIPPGCAHAGEPFDMTVETLNTDYVASNNYLNGLRGKSGQVNCNAGSEARMKFTMVRDGTDEAVTLPAFYISVYDIDQNGYMSEEVVVGGYDEITIPDDKEFDVEDTDTGKRLTSTHFGRICDNPKEPTNLHVINCYGTDEVDQRRRAVTMLFLHKASFELTFKVHLTRDVSAAGQGRQLLFGGPTNLIQPCGVTAPPTTAAPLATPAPAPTTVAPTTAPCIPDVIHFDFENAVATHRNLGGKGPDLGDDHWVLYENIGSLNGNPFDMKVVTHNSDYLAGKPEKTGLQGKSGQINVKVDSQAELTFSFIDDVTGDPVTLPAFYISIFDVDVGPACGEVIEVNGYDEINIPEDHEFEEVDGPDGGKTITATHLGWGCDNPPDPENLGSITCQGQTVDTRKRSFSMLYKNKHSFDVKFLTPPFPNTEELRAQFPTAGRNMQFAGTSGLSDECS